MKTFLILFAIVGLTATAQAQTVLYTFDTPADFATDFNTTGTALSNASSGGLNNTGAIAYSTSDVNGFSTVNAGAVSFSTASNFSITQSTYFQVDTRTDEFGRDDRRSVQLGLTEATSVTYDGGGLVAETSLTAGIFTELYDTGASDQVQVEFYASTTTPDNNFQLTNLDITLNDAAWYFLSIDYNYVQSTDDWQIEWSLNNASSDGTIGSSVSSQVSSTNGSNVFGANPDLRGYLGTRSAQRTSIGILDNATLVAVPEPSVAALFAGALVGLIALRRRRQA